MSSKRSRADASVGLRWFDSLQVKLALLFLLILVLLAGVSLYAGRQWIGAGLDSSSFRYEDAVSRRLAAEITEVVREAENFAGTLALIAQNDRSQRKALVEQAAARLPPDSAIGGLGIWPEPTTTSAGAARDSLVWLRDSKGRWQSRGDYNDPATISYWREPWYTPARLSISGRCYWTSRYRDLLSTREVVTCTLPLSGARGFEGAVTVSLDLEAFAAHFVRATGADSGYALITDRDNHLLALSATAKARLGETFGSGRDIAELAQKLPYFNPLALRMHSLAEAFLGDALRTPAYDARKVSQLKDSTRDLARIDAESILAAIWNDAAHRTASPSERLIQPRDPVLGEDAYAVLATLPDTQWHLASATPAREGQGSSLFLLTRTLLAMLGAVSLALLAAFVFFNWTVIRPLSRMTRTLAGGELDTALQLTLDESSRNELGALAHWYNERAGQLRELLDRAQYSGAQLAIETAERQRAQDALARALERSHLTLTTIDDGVVTLDERGRVEDMNPVAEQLFGVNLRAVRGTPFAQSFNARLGGSSGIALPNPAESAIESGNRIEYADGVFLGGEGTAGREVYLSVAPLRARNGRAMGCVVVVRRLAARLSGGAGLAEAPDPVTGLGGRNACERRVRALIDSTRTNPHTHALLVLDASPPRRRRRTDSIANDDGFHARLAELLIAYAGRSEDVFCLPGKRFAVTIERTDATLAQGRAEALLDRVLRALQQAGADRVDRAASIGVCMIDAGIDGAAEAIRRAGAACDSVQRRGGAATQIYSADSEQTAALADDLVWAKRIRLGLEQDRFHLTTQWLAPAPIHADQGQVFEMLLALEDEEGFWAPSANFMRAAERHQLAGELDRWMIRCVFQLLAGNPGQSHRLSICIVNLSSASLTDPALLDFIAESLNAHPGVPVNKLCFALRDDSLDENPQAAQRFCEALRAFGCRTAVDQRNGHQVASIDRLRTLPIDFLKLDGQQFRRLTDDVIDQTLAESALRLAHLLQQRVVVAHVDDEANAAIWRRLGADYLQGFAIARPSPVPFTSPGI